MAQSRGGYMSKETYRQYCIGCSNYLPLHRFFGRYFCIACRSQIRQALRKAGVSWQERDPDQAAIASVIDQTIEDIQAKSDGERKKTEKSWKLSKKEWRVLRGRRYRKKTNSSS